MKRKSANEWRTVVEKWLSSGQSRAQFAKTHGLHPTTLSWWRWRLALDAKPEEPPAFLDVVVDSPPLRPPDLVVELGDQLRVRVPAGFDPHELRRLMDALC